jgi:hypothetical protein
MKKKGFGLEHATTPKLENSMRGTYKKKTNTKKEKRIWSASMA